MYKGGTGKPTQVANDIFGTKQSYAHYEVYLALQLCDESYIKAEISKGSAAPEPV